MKPPRFTYEAPTRLQEVLEQLARHGDGARPLAGGQSLVPAMNLRLANPGHLIDLNRVPELRGIQALPDGRIRAGAMTRHTDFEHSELLRERIPLIPAVMRFVAHEAIRQRGTIGGSLAHADPAAEWAGLCWLLDATIELSSEKGTRRVPAVQFTTGVYSTGLQTGELITAVEFPAWPAQRRWAFDEISRRRGDFAITGVMCTLDLDPQGLCERARCILFAASETPCLLNTDALAGRALTMQGVEQFAREAARNFSFLHDRHASAEYRQELAQTLTARALARAAEL
jgi:aerobic carbon-monoxide dehydrogenase medium subunit